MYSASCDCQDCGLIRFLQAKAENDRVMNELDEALEAVEQAAANHRNAEEDLAIAIERAKSLGIDDEFIVEASGG